MAQRLDVQNHLPEIGEALGTALAAAVGEVADSIAAEIRRRASSRLDRSVQVDHADGALAATIGIGSNSALHAGFEEFGTIGRAPNPFIIPAVEAKRRESTRIVTDAVKDAVAKAAL